MLSKKDLAMLNGTQQLSLYRVEKQIEYDGVEMGVLENGMPYLSENGLARMCGIDRRALNRLAENWIEEKEKPRGKIINSILLESGYTDNDLYLSSKFDNSDIHAYTEPVCLAILEYYAMHSDERRPEAIRAFRSLARQSFRSFIYAATKYSPEQRKLESWKNYHDRVSMLKDATPKGFFGVFNEMAMMIVPMIDNGVYVSSKIVPDISVGIEWSKHWKKNNLDETYGQRTRYNHSYPDYYPQAKSNPQESFAYPNTAIGEFREWLIDNYVADKFPKYVVSKVKDMSVSSKDARLAIAAFAQKKELRQ